MAINDFAFACSVDGSIVGYFTYHERTMLIVQSEQEAKAGINNFLRIAEPFMEPLISHESIHVIIKKLEGAEASDSLDEVEVIVERGGVKLQVPLNFIHYSHDNSGIVLPFKKKIGARIVALYFISSETSRWLIAISSTRIVILYHLSLCLKMCAEVFLLPAEPYPPTRSLSLDRSLST